MKFRLIVLSLVANAFAFHPTHEVEGRASFGPEVPSAFFKFDNLATLRGDQEDADEWLARYMVANFGFFAGRDYEVTDSYASHNSVVHVHMRQLVNGIPIANALMNVNILYNSILSIGSSFVQTDEVSQFILLAKTGNDVKTQATLSPTEALLFFTEYIGVELDIQDLTLQASLVDSSFTISNPGFANKDIPATLKYIHSNGKLVLAWNLEVQMHNNWFNAHVDSETGEVLSVNDWVSHASYNVYPLGTNDPLSGPRRVVADPAVKIASPSGWHTDDQTTYKTTRGNNVIAQENADGRNKWENNFRPESETLDFNFAVDLEAKPLTYINASITNLFYWNNIMHDLFYVYGFDEQSGNFQKSNKNKGGKGDDAVIANAQDGSGYNNANFATPPDGQNGRMRMYVWDVTQPERDGDFESGIIIHEYSHGISTRLTGGPQNSNCLGWGESGGMGEGWGDFHATILQMTPNSKRTDDFTMGSYANGGRGIRKFPYSTNMDTNPTTYSYISKPEYSGVHAKGEVWAEILYEVYWNIVDKKGFEPDWYSISPTDSTEYVEIFSGLRKKKKPSKKRPSPPDLAGNLIMLQLVIDGMKLQPCYPSFIDARDAIIQADKVNNRVENTCDLWAGFAKRGLGFSARSNGKEKFDVPEECGANGQAQDE